jgi:hypothetical protein
VHGLEHAAQTPTTLEEHQLRTRRRFGQPMSGRQPRNPPADDRNPSQSVSLVAQDFSPTVRISVIRWTGRPSAGRQRLFERLSSHGPRRFPIIGGTVGRERGERRARALSLPNRATTLRRWAILGARAMSRQHKTIMPPQWSKVPGRARRGRMRRWRLMIGRS